MDDEEEDEEQQYIDANELANYTQPDNWNVLSLNIRSVKKKVPNLQILLENTSVDVIFLQEIWKPNTIRFDGYQKHLLKRKDVDGKKTGGGLAILSKYDFKILTEEICSILEYQVAAITLPNNTRMLCCNTYVPPESNKTEAIAKLGQVLAGIDFNSYGQTLLVGDLNIDFLVNPTEILDLAVQLESISYSTFPTRITKKSSTCIDHFIAKHKNVKVKIVKTDVSDHFAILGMFELESQGKQERNIKYIRILKEKNLDALATKI